MKAAFYTEHGSVDVLQLGELPTPPVADDEVLVEIVAAGVNPIDRRLRSGELQEYITRTFPVVPGWDLAGRPSTRHRSRLNRRPCRLSKPRRYRSYR